MGPGLLVVKHRAEIAHIKPVLKEVKLDRGRPMASAKGTPKPANRSRSLTGAIATIT
jgi:hypothetical protein